MNNLYTKSSRSKIVLQKYISSTRTREMIAQSLAASRNPNHVIFANRVKWLAPRRNYEKPRYLGPVASMHAPPRNARINIPRW